MIKLNEIMSDVMVCLCKLSNDHDTLIVETSDDPYCLDLRDMSNVETCLRILGKNNIITLFNLGNILKEKIWVSRNKVMLISTVREVKEQQYTLWCSSSFGTSTSIVPQQHVHEVIEAVGFSINDIFITSDMEFNKQLNSLLQLEGDVVKRLSHGRCVRVIGCFCNEYKLSPKLGRNPLSKSALELFDGGIEKIIYDGRIITKKDVELELLTGDVSAYDELLYCNYSRNGDTLMKVD